MRKELDGVLAGSKWGELKTKLDNSVYERVKNSALAESYNERARLTEKFKADLSQYTEKEQKIVQKAIDSGVLNNTNRSHELVDLVAKLSADKGVDFDFMNNEKLKESGFAIEGKTVNGFVTENGIVINTQSPKYLNSVVGHEITHVLKGSELFGSLQETLFNYAKSKGEYDTRFESVKEAYKGIENVDINEELTADLVGDYLFTDRDFVASLSTNNRNVFERLYNEIKYLCKIATAGTKEARELLKVKKIFDEVYRGETKAVEGVKYSANSGESSSIKEQLINYKTQLESMPVIASINTTQEFNNAKEGYDWAVQTLKQSGYKTDRVGFGIIVFDEKRLKNGLRYLKTNSEYTAYALIPKVLKNGIVIGEHSNHKGRGYDTVTFTAPVEIDGVRGNMAVVVRQEGKNYYKLHRVLMPDGGLFEYKKGSSAERAAATPSVVDTPTDTTSNVIIPNSNGNVNRKNSLSPIAPETSPGGTLKITSEDVTLKKPEVQRKAESDLGDIPIRDDIAPPIKQTSSDDGVFFDGASKTKERGWVKTATESDVVDKKILAQDLSEFARSYVPISNEATLEGARANIASLGYDAAKAKAVSLAESGSKASLVDIAESEVLLSEALRRGDTKTAGEIIENLAILGTELGQKVQALSLINRMTPEGQLKMLEKIVKRAQVKIDGKGPKAKPRIRDKAFEGIEITEEIKNMILGVYEKDGSFDRDELNRAVEEAKQKLADQMQVTWGEKLNAWRYLSMLGNPKTHLRNVVSNVAMMATTNVKNAVARTAEDLFLKSGDRTKT